jgi:hypothetical protein
VYAPGIYTVVLGAVEGAGRLLIITVYFVVYWELREVGKMLSTQVLSKASFNDNVIRFTVLLKAEEKLY